MTTKRQFAVTILVEVSEDDSVWDAALYASQLERNEFEDLCGTLEEPDVGACLRMLLDPGESQDFEILDCTSEELS